MKQEAPQVEEGQTASLSIRLLAQLAEILRLRTGVDVGEGRHDYVLRALGKRLRARQKSSLRGYMRVLEDEPQEARRLAKALLPADQDLFLAPEVFAALSQQLHAAASARRVPRLWVAECGEGEDAYALALLIAEYLDSQQLNPAFLLFAAEPDAGALALARSGVLAPAFASQLPKHLAGFLKPLASGAAVKPLIAARCAFLAHDIGSALPETGLELIAGRNILRFLDLASQRHLLERWHAALANGGLLLLGRSETLQGHEDLFAPRALAPGVWQRQPERAPNTSGSLKAQALGLDADIAIYRRSFAALIRPSAILDAEGLLLDVNRAFARYFGRAAETLRGQPLAALAVEDERAALAQRLRLLPVAVRETLSVRFTAAAQPLRMHLQGHGGQRIRAHVEFELGDALPSSQFANVPPALAAALDAMSEGLILCDADGRVEAINSAASRLTGWGAAQVLGEPHERVFRLVTSLGDTLESPLSACLRDGQPCTLSGAGRLLLARDSRRFSVEARALPSPRADGRIGAALLFEDISQRLLLAEELAWRASHDPLTGLLNRDEFELRLRKAVSQAGSGGEVATLCLLDIDQFRLINDELGHTAGDELLHELAGALRARLREQDVFARFSGDEFALLLPGQGLTAAEPVVQALLEAARSYRFFWREQSYSLTLSIGVAGIGPETGQVGRVLSLADAACHAAKLAGRDRARWMGVDDEAYRHHHEMSVVRQLGRALEENRLLLVVEDVVQVQQPGQVMYRELLVRMRGDNGELVKPSDFIPAAERYNLMSALDRWVIRHGLAGIARIPTARDAEVLYALNVSGQSLGDPEFLPFVLDELGRSGIAPQRIVFEITETAAISQLAEASRFVARLTERGCRFALDDFGAGMSNFGYLRNFPVHFLKIDGSFVRSMHDSRIDRGMVETINRIGHELGLKTIAEHVESLDLLAPLRSMGVDWAQGRGISEARPLDELMT